MRHRRSGRNIGERNRRKPLYRGVEGTPPFAALMDQWGSNACHASTNSTLGSTVAPHWTVFSALFRLLPQALVLAADG